MRPTSRPCSRAVTACLATALVLAGCGQETATAPAPLVDLPSPTASPAEETAEGTGEEAGEATGPAAAPVAAYNAWLSALAERDAAAACARQAPQLKIDLRYEAILLKRARLGDPCVDFVAVLWEEPDREYDPVAIETTQATDEDAFLAVDFPAQDQTVRMIQQDTRWLVAESVARTGGGEPERWLDVWCDLELEMTPPELIELMGEPSGTYTIDDGGEPQLYWAQDQYDFRAYLDADPPTGAAIDLVGDYDRLSAAERDALTCPELR